MGLRIQAYILGSVLLLVSTLASALGLGELKLNSALNQPLNAEIELRNVRGLTEREIRIGMASHEAFTNAGVERAYFLSDFRFQVDLQAPGGPVVRVTSNNPVREPFLNFIVQAEWPSGRLLREYTVLVDLPAFSGAPAEPTRAAPRAATQAQPDATPRRPAVQPSERRSAPARLAEGEYGPVGANENLWSIASRARPDNSVSVQQTMLAIQRLNPNAFINDNINLLRRGQVLRLPDLSEIQQLSQREAVNEVAAQNRRWTERSDTARAPQIEGRRDLRPTPSTPDAVEGRVRLSTQEARDESGVAAGRESEQRAISNQLNVAQEQLDAARRENSELNSRIRAMEEQMETMERLLEISSDEMRALELVIRQTDEARRTDEEPLAPPAPAEEQPVVTDEPAPPEAVAERPVTAEPVRPEPVVVRTEQTLMDRLFDNLLYIAIGLGVLVIAAAAVIYMRRRNDGFDDDDFDDFDADYSMEEEYSEGDDLADDNTVIMAGAANLDDDGDVATEEHRFAEAETEDVVAECDIHIAYGQYGQAEEKLLRALESEPTNSAMRVKLLEVYAAQGDGESFDHQYARLRSLGDRPAIDRAEVLRSTIPGISSFDASQFDSGPVETSRFEQDDSAQSVDGDFMSDSGQEDDTLQFDLDDPETPATPESKWVGSAEVEEDLDLSLDDLDLDEEATAKPRSVAGDDLEELDLELADDDFDVDFDELDLALDEPSAEMTPSADQQLEKDELTLEPMEGEFDALPERTAILEEPELDFELDDEASAEQDDSSEEFGKLTSEFSDNVVAENRNARADELPDLDFDFDDLELEDDASKQDALDSLEDGDLDFDDKHVDFDLVDRSGEPEESKPEQAPGLIGLDDDTLEDDSDLEGWDDLDKASDAFGSDQLAAIEAKRSGPQNSELDDELSSLDDFDADVDLDGEFNLDQLDQELDSLSGDLDELEEPAVPAPSSSQPSRVAEEAGRGVDTQQDFEIPDFDPEEDDDSNLGFLSDSDETATKLDLARAYIDMGDADGARDILDEIAEEGNDEQKRQAQDLLSRLS